uniref:Wsv136-like protein n=1 Tax=Melicertus latisulcatus pemonivirus TaxID=2984278 RepID=A0A9C7C8D4_9VIRU|nr:MAG: wsv136-like protein [Melicertus latisulcatus pemonivirus]
MTKWNSKAAGAIQSSQLSGGLLLFLVCVTMMAVLYLIRLDVTLAAASRLLGVEASIQDRFTPIISQTVGLSFKTLATGHDTKSVVPPIDLTGHQMDPRSMLTSLLGSSYSRSDYV